MKEAEFLKIKRDNETCKARIERLKGSIETLSKGMLDAFGVSTSKQAATKIRQLEKELIVAKKNLQTAWKELQDGYSERIKQLAGEE